MECKNSAELLVTSLKDVRDTAIKTLNGEMPDKEDRWIVINDWWERVGKELYQDALKTVDSTELLDSIENVFPGISKMILGTLSLTIENREFTVKEICLQNASSENMINIALFTDGKPNHEGLDWVSTRSNEEYNYKFTLIGSYQGEKTQTLSFDYEDPLMQQLLETIDPM